MSESFLVIASWGPREENITEVVNKTLAILQQLKSLDVQFLQWYELGNSRSQALKKPISLTEESIYNICKRKLKKDELVDNRFSPAGYTNSFWSGHDDGEASTISFGVGSYSEYLTNICSITLPYDGDARSRLLVTKTILSLCKILVDVWNPDSVILVSSSLRSCLNENDEIGWVTYKKTVKQMPVLGDGNLKYQKMGPGYCFYLDTPTQENNQEFINELLVLNDV